MSIIEAFMPVNQSFIPLSPVFGWISDKEIQLLLRGHRSIAGSVYTCCNSVKLYILIYNSKETDSCLGGDETVVRAVATSWFRPCWHT